MIILQIMIKCVFICVICVTMQKQLKLASNFLATEMGLSVNRASRDKIPITLSKDEIKLYVTRFQLIDRDHKGYVSVNDIRRGMKVYILKNDYTCSFNKL